MKLDEDAALFLDIDGTLVELAPTPDAARVPDDLPGLLRDLDRSFCGALALVSGRSLASIDALFAPAKPVAAGSHGMERRTAGGAVERPCPPPWLDRALVAAEAFVGNRTGMLIERKDFGVGIHFRGAPEMLAPTRDFVLALKEDFGPTAAVQEGKMVFELRESGMNKGDAIAWFLDRPPFRGRRPVFAGDDHTDEYGFRAVSERGGIAIWIGSEPHRLAEYRFATPAEFRQWLREQVASMRNQKAFGSL